MIWHFFLNQLGSKYKYWLISQIENWAEWLTLTISICARLIQIKFTIVATSSNLLKNLFWHLYNCVSVVLVVKYLKYFSCVKRSINCYNNLKAVDAQLNIARCKICLYSGTIIFFMEILSSPVLSLKFIILWHEKLVQKFEHLFLDFSFLIFHSMLTQFH